MPVSMRLGWRLRHTSTAVPSALRPSAEQEEEDAAHWCSTAASPASAWTSDEVLGLEAPAPRRPPRSRASRSARSPSACRCRTGGLERLAAVGRRRGHHDRGSPIATGPVRWSRASRPVAASGAGPRRRSPRAGARPAPRRPRTRAAARRLDPRRGRGRCPRTPRRHRSRAAPPSRSRHRPTARRRSAAARCRSGWAVRAHGHARRHRSNTPRPGLRRSGRGHRDEARQ